MRRGFYFWTLSGLCGLMLVSSVLAGRQRDKAGRVENGIYSDDDFSFNLTIRDNWRARIGDGKDPVRLVLTESDYDIPVDYKDAPNYTKIPRMVMYVDTSSLAPGPFIDSLLSRTYKSKQKSSVVKEFDILQEQALIQRGKRPAVVAGMNGSRWDANAKYTKEVQTSASSVGGSRVTGAYAATIVAVKKERTIFVFHIMCEAPFHESVMTQIQEMLASMNFGSATADSTNKGK